MNLPECLADTSLKSKAKVALIGNGLLEGDLSVGDVMAFASLQGGATKGTCLECIELATRKRPELADRATLDFVTESLDDEEPRVKWEAARIIGNVAPRFPTDLDAAIEGLLRNSTHSGTVVRWATSFALGTILLLDSERSPDLLPVLESLSEKEGDSGVQKKYLAAITKARKRRGKDS